MIDYNFSIRKVISGGQTGADIAGLRAAATSGIETGGTAPKDFMTANGPNPELAKYGLIAKGSYKTRTIQNIKDADFTIIIYEDRFSPGTKLTIQQCIINNKPFIECNITPMTHMVPLLIDYNSIITYVKGLEYFVEEITLKIKEHTPEIVNIAGNRERYKEQFIEKVSFDILCKVFWDINGRLQHE